MDEIKYCQMRDVEVVMKSEVPLKATRHVRAVYVAYESYAAARAEGGIPRR